MDYEKKLGEMFDVLKIKKHFLLENWYSTDMIPGCAKNEKIYIVPQRFGIVIWGNEGGRLEIFQLKTIYFLIFSLGMWLHTYIGTDKRDLVLGIPYDNT